MKIELNEEDKREIVASLREKAGKRSSAGESSKGKKSEEKRKAAQQSSSSSQLSRASSQIAPATQQQQGVLGNSYHLQQLHSYGSGELLSREEFMRVTGGDEREYANYFQNFNAQLVENAQRLRQQQQPQYPQQQQYPHRRGDEFFAEQSRRHLSFSHESETDAMNVASTAELVLALANSPVPAVQASSNNNNDNNQEQGNLRYDVLI